MLPPGADAALATAKTAAEEAVREEAAARAQHAASAAELAASVVDDAVLAEAEAVQRLIAARTQSEQSEADIPKRQAELADAQGAIARLLRELSSPADPADAATELRSAADIAAARDLIAAAGDIAAARTAALAAVERARDAIGAAEDDLTALPETAATEALRAAHDEAVALGDPAVLARQAQTAVSDAAARAAAALGRVPGWTGTMEELAALPAPADAALTRLDKALGLARAAAVATQARRTDAQATLQAARDRLDAATGTRPLPDGQRLPPPARTGIAGGRWCSPGSAAPETPRPKPPTRRRRRCRWLSRAPSPRPMTWPTVARTSGRSWRPRSRRKARSGGRRRCWTTRRERPWPRTKRQPARSPPGPRRWPRLGWTKPPGWRRREPSSPGARRR